MDCIVQVIKLAPVQENTTARVDTLGHPSSKMDLVPCPCSCEPAYRVDGDDRLAINFISYFSAASFRSAFDSSFKLVLFQYRYVSLQMKKAAF